MHIRRAPPMDALTIYRGGDGVIPLEAGGRAHIAAYLALLKGLEHQGRGAVSADCIHCLSGILKYH